MEVCIMKQNNKIINVGVIKELSFYVNKSEVALTQYKEGSDYEKGVVKIGESIIGYVRNLIFKFIRGEKLTKDEIAVYNDAFLVCLTLDELIYWSKRFEVPVIEEIFKILEVKV